MPDADLDETAANIVAKKVGFAGQTCVNYNRIYVHESVYIELCEKVAKELSRVKLGRYKDEGYVMGPVINNKARDRMLELIDDAVKNGAKLVMGGRIPPNFQREAILPLHCLQMLRTVCVYPVKKYSDRLSRCNPSPILMMY